MAAMEGEPRCFRRVVHALSAALGQVFQRESATFRSKISITRTCAMPKIRFQVDLSRGRVCFQIISGTGMAHTDLDATPCCVAIVCPSSALARLLAFLRVGAADAQVTAAQEGEHLLGEHLRALLGEA